MKNVGSRDGFALLAALGMLVAASALVLRIGLEARIMVRAADTYAHGVRVEAAARYAALTAVDSLSDLMRTDPSGGLLLEPFVSIDTVDEVIVSTVVSDLGSKLHINSARATELRSVLVLGGIGSRAVDIAAESIADWRDADDLHRANGAEAGW